MPTIDRLLKPKTLEADPIDERSAKVYKHWIKTFEAFLAVAIQPSADTSAGEDGEESSAPETPNKLALLINHQTFIRTLRTVTHTLVPRKS